MSRSGKKAGRAVTGKRLSEADIGDVTLDDFANASGNRTTGRLKKYNVNKLVSKVKVLSLEDDRPWHEKVNDLEAAEEQIVTVRKHQNQRTKTEVEEEISDGVGCHYPKEVWFLISEHIRPEDVGTFAAICKDCMDIVSTAQFWFALYKRYYRNVANLPERLRPELLVRRYGLRANVIRSLYFMYPPFISKLNPQLMMNRDLHSLVKRLCVHSWSQKKKNQWLFYFKLKQSSAVKYGRNNSEDYAKPTLLEMLEDVTANLDNNCKVLQVTCLNYIPLPMISGQTLSSVSQTLSQGLQYHKIQLNFGCGLSPDMSNNFIVLDPVLSVQILDWWHPSFPHTDGLNNTLYSNEGNCPFDEIEF